MTALDWLRETRANVAAENPRDDGWQVQVSDCCHAICLMWDSRQGGCQMACTACRKPCGTVDFDPLYATTEARA